MQQSPDRLKIVFADADGTLFRHNSLFSFLRFDAASTNKEKEAEQFLQQLMNMRDQGIPREVTSQLYFTWWKGRNVDEVNEIGEHFAKSIHYLDWENEAVTNSIQDLNYDLMYVLSASFLPALTILQKVYPEVRIICTELEVSSGLFTGNINQSMLSEQKAEQVRIAINQIQDSQKSNRPLQITTYGYGDHITDVNFLKLCDFPHVVYRQSPPSWASQLTSYTLLSQDKS